MKIEVKIILLFIVYIVFSLECFCIKSKLRMNNLIAKETTIIGENFSSNSFLNLFSEQCSYDDQGCSNHFKLVDYNGQSYLECKMLSTDLPFKDDSKTKPRTELSFKDKMLIKNDKEYVVTWNILMKEYSNPAYEFSLFQLFSTIGGPNVMLRWNNKRYELYIISTGNKFFPVGELTEDLYQITTWRVSFRISQGNNGYVRIQKKLQTETKFSLVGEKTNIPTAYTKNDQTYLKLGIYTQCEKPFDATMLINNMTLAEL